MQRAKAFEPCHLAGGTPRPTREQSWILKPLLALDIVESGQMHLTAESRLIRPQGIGSQPRRRLIKAAGARRAPPGWATA